ncbi:MAG TPA: hypothetical protein VFN27_06880 [Xanthobacteraceae bacterium]|nr:hypothetical protein [Xanthobacteraceae bacterium]
MTSVYQHKLPIWSTLSAAYREWRRMLPALRPLVINAFLIVLAISALDQFVPARLADQEFFGTAITLAEAAVRAFLLTPILVAIHRFVILDEITKTYAVPLREPAFRRFFAWLFTFEVLAGFPLDILGALQALNVTFAASTAGFVAALVVTVALMVRLSILPPAIAVDAPGARLGAALEDTKGCALRVFAIFFVAIVPWLAIDLAVIALIGRGVAVTGSASGMIGLVFGGILQTALLTLMAVIASLLFIALGTHVRRHAHPSGPA